MLSFLILSWAMSRSISTVGSKALGLPQDAKEYSGDARAADVKYDGFTAHASGSDNAERLTVTWIAHKKSKKEVASGESGTQGPEDRGINASENA